MSEPMYANLTRSYNGLPTLYEALRNRGSATFRCDFVCGNYRGYWGQAPVKDVDCSMGTVAPEVMGLTGFVDRTLDDPIAILSDTIMRVIEKAWDPGAFHLVLHSSGWDSRIISGAIKRLSDANGSDWMGNIIFLSNRWEGDRFARIMGEMGWRRDQCVVYNDGQSDDEHFSCHVYDVWHCAPFPRPGNFLRYLPQWACEQGIIPATGVQTFTGLWANEVWECFVRDNSDWPRMVKKRYGGHMIAGMPVWGDRVEYPLVEVSILDILRRVNNGKWNGNVLRRSLADHMNPWAARVRPNVDLSDGYHPLSDRLRNELDGFYRNTEFGCHVEWCPPQDSGNSPDWGRWSLALLAEKLIEEGVECYFD